jgi:hypothetical protein
MGWQVCLFNADSSLSVGDLAQQCQQRLHKEKELLMSPLYYYHHKQLLPGCFDRCVCILRRGE